MRLIAKLLVIALVISFTQACVSKKKYDELAAAKEQTDQALAQTQQQVQDLESENEQIQAELQSEKERLNGEIASIKQDLDNAKSQMAQVSEKLNMTEEELTDLRKEINDMFAGYKASGLNMEARDGRLYLMTDSGIQYNSGSSRLSSEERSALDALASKLSSNKDLHILVEGHTDDVPVKEGAAIGNNWNLSVARAMGVVRYLIRQGVDPSQVAAVARGEYMPTADNDTAEGRAENRRTVILPDVAAGLLMEKGEN